MIKFPFWIWDDNIFIVCQCASQALKILANKIIAWLTDILEEGRGKKIFSFRSTPRTKALMIAGTMLGSVQLSRVTGSKDFLLIKEGIIDELMY